VLGAVLSPHLAAALIVLAATVVYLAVVLRSYRRNRNIYGRTPLESALVAFGAAWCWPATLFYWAFGPTPERTQRRRSGTRNAVESLGYRYVRNLRAKQNHPN